MQKEKRERYAESVNFFMLQLCTSLGSVFNVMMYEKGLGTKTTWSGFTKDCLLA